MIVTLICMLFGVLSIFVIAKPQYLIKYLVVSYALNVIFHIYALNSIVISLGGITLYLADLPVIVMVFLFLLRGAVLYKTKMTAALSGVFFMIVYSAVMGIFTYGLNLYYLSDIRVYLSMIVPIMYFYNCPHVITDSDIRFVNKVLAVMVGYCYLCWGLYITTGIKLSATSSAGGFRVWGSTGTIIFAFATLFYIYDDVVRKQRKIISLRTILFILAIVILQHNSVWAALAVGTVILLISVGLNRKDIMRFCFQIAIVFGLALLLVVLIPDNPIVQSVLSTTDKYSQMGTGEGTIGGRQLIWEAYLNELSGVEWLTGKPMGIGWFTNYKGVYSMQPPHNAYVQGVMRIGLLGTVLLFALLFVVFIKNLLNKNSVLAAVMCASFTYLYAYMFSLEMSIVWGIVIGLTYGNITYIGSDQDE